MGRFCPGRRYGDSFHVLSVFTPTSFFLSYTSLYPSANTPPNITSTLYPSNTTTNPTQNPQGISLPLDQFNTLITLLPQIETALASKGQSISRPDYSNAGASAAAMDEDEDEDEDEAEKTTAKKNFEETSDEECD